MSVEFLSEDCIGGQTLLRLVSRGNAIVAELLRMSQNVPKVYRQHAQLTGKKKDSNPSARFNGILFDFAYWNKQDIIEEAIDSRKQLQELDDDFGEMYGDVLRRFYLLFEGIYKYIVDFNKYIEEMNDGVFIQLTMETVLLCADGKQLMTEALYLYGVMFLLMDELIPGPVRERLLVSFYRYKGQTDYPFFDNVCNLVKKSSYVPGQQKPTHYPVKLFSRLTIPKRVIKMIVSRLRSDDIYNKVAAYPQPEHRCTALATQASMLYVIMYFVPEILEKGTSAMREITDKHFADNWIISYYLGYTVDVSMAWAPYTAAKAALQNTLNPVHVARIASRHHKAVGILTGTLDQLLTEGVLTKSYILEKNMQLMAEARRCNVSIRWILLHTLTTHKKLREAVLQGHDKEKFLEFLLKTAQFEFLVKKVYQELLTAKHEQWTVCKEEASQRMKEMGDYFSGEKALVRVKKNSSLEKWFHGIGEKVAGLNFGDSTLAGRKIQQIMQALEEVQQFHQMDTNKVVMQFLIDTQQYLVQMMRIANVTEEYLGNLAMVADISYAWQVIRSFVPMMQQQIRKDPHRIILMRSTFLKLASILDMPLVRINQASSADLVSVSEFYSSELVKFVRKVLAIVPRSMFLLLNDVIDAQTNHLKELPTKVEKAQMEANFIQTETRRRLAQTTHAISVFTEGMLAMEKTLVGVVEVDPKKLLEDGIRKELVEHIAEIMDTTMVMTTRRPDELDSRANELASKLDGFRRSFQYVQDYISIYGLKVWQEEFSRIINFNVEQECNAFLKKAVAPRSQYQSAAIRIPVFPPADKESVNFIGRLARELVRLTNYRSTTYLGQMSGWFSAERGVELIGIRSFTLLVQSVGVFGVTGLDKLFCFMIVKLLQDYVMGARRHLRSLRKFLALVGTNVHPTTTIPNNADKLYQSAVAKTSKFYESFLGELSRIGQLQLLRRQIANLLNFEAKVESKVFYHALSAMNTALLADIEAHYKSPETKPYPDEDENPLLSEMSKYLEAVGINDPVTKIYITAQPIEHFPLMMFLFVISQVPKFVYDPHLSIITSTVPRKKGGVDVTPFVVGFATVLKQFHSIHTQKFLAYCGQYIRSYVNAPLAKGASGTLPDIPKEARQLMVFLEALCKHSSSISRRDLEGYVPPYIFDNFRH